jgi:hypothetical protein
MLFDFCAIKAGVSCLAILCSIQAGTFEGYQLGLFGLVAFGSSLSWWRLEPQVLQAIEVRCCRSGSHYRELRSIQLPIYCVYCIRTHSYIFCLKETSLCILGTRREPSSALRFDTCP